MVGAPGQPHWGTAMGSGRSGQVHSSTKRPCRRPTPHHVRRLNHQLGWANEPCDPRCDSEARPSAPCLRPLSSPNQWRSVYNRVRPHSAYGGLPTTGLLQPSGPRWHRVRCGPRIWAERRTPRRWPKPSAADWTELDHVPSGRGEPTGAPRMGRGVSPRFPRPPGPRWP
jgi:hypothetical protein